MSMADKEPTIDWLIDELAPNKGKSPLVDFNKKRLKALIHSQIVAELERLKGQKQYQQCKNCKGGHLLEVVSVEEIDKVINQLKNGGQE